MEYFVNWAGNSAASSANSCDGVVIKLQQASHLQFRQIQQKRQRNASGLQLSFNHSPICGHHPGQIHTVNLESTTNFTMCEFCNV